MMQELTKEGLFSHFDPRDIAILIELPVVKRNLSSHEESLCRKFFVQSRRNSVSLRTESVHPEQAILSFEALRHATIHEIVEYFTVQRVCDLYSRVHGYYFELLVSNIVAAKNTPDRTYGQLFCLLDEVSEKTIILAIQSAMALPLGIFNNALAEQNILLEEIADEFTFYSTKAQKFIVTVQERDVKYKQMVINLAFSILRLGLNIANAGELITVSQSLAELATSTLGNIQAQFPNLITEIEKLVANTNAHALCSADKQLLATTLPEDVARGWARYRHQVFHQANSQIQRVLDTCVNNDMFYRCVIKETLAEQPHLNNERLLIHTTEKAKNYITSIVTGLQKQVAIIRQVRNAALSKGGGDKIEQYFQKICLINYAKHHEGVGGTANKWLTKRLGHLLTRNFPEKVFQEKFSPVTLMGLFHLRVKYCQRDMTTEEYRMMRAKSSVVLSAFRNSSVVKDELMRNLDDLIPHLGDLLIEELQAQQVLSPVEDPLVDTYATLGKKGRYSFVQRQRVLFDFSQPTLALEGIGVALGSLPTPEGSPVLTSHRRRSSES